METDIMILIIDYFIISMLARIQALSCAREIKSKKLKLYNTFPWVTFNAILFVMMITPTIKHLFKKWGYSLDYSANPLQSIILTILFCLLAIASFYQINKIYMVTIKKYIKDIEFVKFFPKKQTETSEE